MAMAFSYWNFPGQARFIRSQAGIWHHPDLLECNALQCRYNVPTPYILEKFHQGKRMFVQYSVSDHKRTCLVNLLHPRVCFPFTCVHE